MSKTMKRFVMIVAGLIAILMLSACGNVSNPDPTRPSLPIEETEPPVTGPADIWYGFDDEDCVADLVLGSMLAGWLETHEGADGVLEMIPYNDWPFVGNDQGPTWLPVYSAEAYDGATGLKFRVKLEGTTWYQLVVLAPGLDRVILYEGAHQDGWVEFVWNIDVAANYDALKAMYFGTWMCDNVGAIYIDSITPVYPDSEPPTTEPPLAEPEGTWYGFSSADSASGLVLGSALTTWLETHEGANGVLEMLPYNDWPFVGNDNGVTWQPAFDAAAYEGATGLSFRVKLEDSAWYQLVVLAPGLDRVVLYEGATVDGWMDLVWYIDVAANYDALKALYFGTWMCDNIGAIYIDSITAVYSEPPVIEPPTTEPPATEPPATEPPATEPPATEPPATEPPATEPEDVWYDFSSADSASNLVLGSTLASWLESYEGANGVLKMLPYNDWPFVGNDSGITWQPALDAAACEGATGLKFRVKLEGTTWYQLIVLAPGLDRVVLYDGAHQDGWVEFVWNIDVAANYDALKAMYFGTWFSGNTGAMYIDSITLVYPDSSEPEPPATEPPATEPPATEPPATEPEGTWYGFSSADCASGLLYGGSVTSWLESYDGANGVIKLSAYNDWPFFGHDNGVTWQPAFNAAAYEGATGLKFRVKFEGANGYQLNVYAYGTLLKQLYDGVHVDGWVEFVLDIDVAANYETLKGIYFTTVCWGNTGAIYIDSITPVYPVVADNWYSFDTEGSVTNLTGNSASTSWLENYEGANGVIKLSANNDWPFYGNTSAVNWQPAFDAAAYEGATGLKFRVKCDGATGYQFTVCAYETVLKQLYDGVTQDGWVELVYETDVAANYDTLKGLYIIAACWGNTGAIYIDSITPVYA